VPQLAEAGPSLGDLAQQVQKLQAEVDEIRNGALPQDKLSMIVFSGDLDKVLASFVIATGAAAMFDEVVMFFTFWGTMALRDPHKNIKGKDFMSTMFGKMLPKGSGALKLSQMNMGGAGTAMMKGLMRKKNVFSLERLIETAAESGVKIYVCEMSMDLMGFSLDEMIDYPGIKLAGVGTFLQDAGTSKSTLFI
jgi:peroxiredoxin family protein